MGKPKLTKEQAQMEADEAKKKKKEEREARMKEKSERQFAEKVKKEYFDAYDTNGDGVLQKDELRCFVNDICDKNGMPRFKEDFFTDLWEAADDDKNKAIDFEEFMKHFGNYCPK